MANGKASSRSSCEKTDKNVLCLHAQNNEELTLDEVLMKHTKAEGLFGTIHGADSAEGKHPKEYFPLFNLYVQDTVPVTLKAV